MMFLDCNAVGGHSGTAWYHATDYNAGWPQLRVFMKDWKEVTITANPLEYVSIGLSKNILIPSDATKVYSGEIIDNGQEAKIKIYNQEINATPKYGYKFTTWTSYNSTYYVVTLEKNIFRLEFTRAFLETTGQGSSYIIPYNQNTGEMATDSNLILELFEGTIITVNINVDKNGYVKNEYIITYNGTETKIVYELMNKKFQIDDWGIDIEEQYVVAEDLIITPTFKLKDYGWIFM